MGFQVEIERKFLVHREKLPDLPPGRHLTQGYLSFGSKSTVRVRLDKNSDRAVGYLTIKGEGLVGRDEFEYEIPAAEAEKLLKLAQASLVSKVRYILPVEDKGHKVAGLKWELDIFEGDNEGLVVAEIEMPNEETTFTHPEWLGDDVTSDPAYKNAALAQHPYKKWS